MSKHCRECIRMDDSCCNYDYAKFTTLKDAERIAKFLNKKINEVVMLAELSEDDKETELFTDKVHNYYYELTDDKDRVLQLKQRKDGSCIFSNENGLCGIYPVRPLICRVFPFWYSNDGEIIVDSNGLTCTILCGSKDIPSWKGVKIKRMDERIAEIGYDRIKLKQLLAQLREEIEEYKVKLRVFIKEHKIKV